MSTEVPACCRIGRRGRATGPEPARRPGRHVRRRPAVRAGRRGVRRGRVRGPLPGPGALLAALQPARARARRGRQPPAAGADPLRRDLRQQPRRVLHGPGRRPEAAHRCRRRRTRGLGTDAQVGARPDLAGLRRADRAARPALPRRPDPGPVEGGHRARPLGPALRRRAEAVQAAVQGPRLPGADAPGGRPGPPVPLHLRPLAQPRRAGAQPQDRQGALRPGQGAADLQPVRAAGQPALRAARGRHRRAPQAALPRHGGAPVGHLPGHPQRGPRGRGGRRREPPQGAGEGAAAAALRSSRAARGRRVHGRARARAADR